MDLPNEVLDIILSHLNIRDLLTVRLASVQLNDVSIQCIKKRQIQITIRSDNQLVEFSKLFPNCSNIFNEDINFNFVLQSISKDILEDLIPKLSKNIVKCTLNVQIHDVKTLENINIMLMEEKLNIVLMVSKNLRNLKIIADKGTKMCKVSGEMLQLDRLNLSIKDISSYSISYSPQFFPDESIVFNSLLLASPNIKILIVKGSNIGGWNWNCLIPPLLKLKKFIVQTGILHGVNSVFNRRTLKNWMLNAPSLEVFEHDCDFRMDPKEYLSSVQHIPFVKPHLHLNDKLITRVTNINRVVSIDLLLNMRDDAISPSITKFLAYQTESLEVLKIINFVKIKLEIPPLKKLKTFVYDFSGPAFHTNELILPIKAENFPNLKSVTFLHKLCNGIIFTKMYPTVETLEDRYFQRNNWLRVFPNLISFRTGCRNYEQYEKFLAFPPKVQHLELCLRFSKWSMSSRFHPDTRKTWLKYTQNTVYYERRIWNMLTGNAQILSGSIFYVENVTDKVSKKPILPILQNLSVLKVKNTRLVHVGAIAYITLHYNFKTFQKLKFYITESIYKTIPEQFITILKGSHNLIFSSRHSGELA